MRIWKGEKKEGRCGERTRGDEGNERGEEKE